MEILVYQHDSNLSLDDYQSAITGLISESCPNLAVDFQPVGLALGEFLEGWLAWQHDEDPYWYFLDSILGLPETWPEKRLLVDASNATGALKDKIKSLGGNSAANWGFYRDIIAWNYAPLEWRVRNLVHESLHCFGVDDCYDEDLKPKSSCDNAKCVMRYGQNAVCIEICSSVKDQLKRYEASV